MNPTIHYTIQNKFHSSMMHTPTQYQLQVNQIWSVL